MNNINKKFLVAGLLLGVLIPHWALAKTAPWSQGKAWHWYQEQRWLVGSNYINQSAINQFEMWQADSFNPAEIDRELGYAERIGMNTMRVFLHDQLWAEDPEGFKARINSFLTLAAKHKIRPLLVLFDSCWDPNPEAGPQHRPIPGVHNSGWMQSPGTARLLDKSTHPALKTYVQDLVKTFAEDDRILGWDVWNEPDNLGGGGYKQIDEQVKVDAVADLLPQVFAWVRAMNPRQPLTSGVWKGDDWTPAGKLNAVEKIQLAESDIISFHDYSWPEVFEARIKQLQAYARPIICTEYMARGNGSTFDGDLPIARKYRVGVINWGLVQGKTQTYLPWDSWEKPYVLRPPIIWFHDIFYPDGRPYRQAEVDMIRRMTQEAETETEIKK